ncbi:hypothetical protein M378DRAFT_92149 [Amanita muscaria Koide BX008]|uniref:Uncharacterized protein n=1 Tax=Amanita muscaria (strain Koide BX008) TaxID=946122 RepID=A0A0C2WEX6_AMAMK|nr:hypothetical protein M378DRAFT_92149 [Amanita muscaria Koide BX008]
MHLICLNIPQHLLEIWQDNRGRTRGNCNTRWEFVVLDGDTWEDHGALVASMHQHLPGSFNRPPRNPAEKINSGYKAAEFLIYIWVLGLALFQLVLLHHLWNHFCKLVCGVRIISQRSITPEDLEQANQMLIEWEMEFEQRYYGRNFRRLHFVRPCVHAIAHGARETVRCGLLNLLAQWALENTIGNIKHEVHLYSNPFINLAEHGVLRAQVNALKAIIPSLDPQPKPRRGSLNIGNGYMLLCAYDRYMHEVPDIEDVAIQTYLLGAGHITAQRVGNFQVQKWA